MDRRSLLATVAGASALAFPGCTGVLDGGGGATDGDDSGDDVGIVSTTRWAVPPERSDTALAGYDLRSVDPSSLLDASDAISAPAVTERLASQSLVQEHLDVPDLDRYVEIQPTRRPGLDVYSVFEGSFSADAVVDELRSADSVEVEQVGTHRGYDVYDSGPGFAVHAVGDGTVVEVDRLRNDDIGPDAVEAIVDAGTGASDRITDVHDGARATAARVRDAHHVGLRIEDPTASTDLDRSRFEGQVASGMDAQVAGDAMTLRMVVTFVSRGAREAAPIDRWIDDTRQDERVDDLSTSIDGRFVTVSVTMPTSALYG